MQPDEKRRAARKAFVAGDYDLSLELSLDLAKYCDADAYYRCAIIYELVRKDLEKAYYFFNRLRAEYGAFDAYNGCARLIIKMHRLEDRSLAEEYCETAIRKHHDGISYLLAGRVAEELCAPPDVARDRRMYLKAASRRAAWGMRKFAALEMKYGSKLMAVFCHVLATLLFPMYRLMFGKRSLRTG
jgi:hypothetical protein